jgi:Ca2+/H+ antiporter
MKNDITTSDMLGVNGMMGNKHTLGSQTHSTQPVEAAAQDNRVHLLVALSWLSLVTSRS